MNSLKSILQSEILKYNTKQELKNYFSFYQNFIFVTHNSFTELLTGGNNDPVGCACLVSQPAFGIPVSYPGDHPYNQAGNISTMTGK